MTRGKNVGVKGKTSGGSATGRKKTPGEIRLPAGIEIKLCSYGRGIFATQSFTKGKLVGEVKGDVITDLDYGSQNCMDLGKYGVLEPSPPFQYLNHCCEPNCELLWELDGRRPRVYVQTIRPIQIGEQLTLDYAWPADEAIPCQCQSASCRGWVVAEEERHLLPNGIAV